MSIVKRVLLGILLLAVVGGVGYGIYYFFFAPAPGAPAVNENVNVNEPGGGLPPAGAAGERPTVGGNQNANTSLPGASPVARGGLTAVSTLVSNTTLAQALGTDGKSVNYYDSQTGKFMSVAPDGTVRELSAQTFPNAQNVTWSPDASLAVVEFPDASKITFNFETQKQTTLPKTWTDFSFSGKGDLVTKNIDVNSGNNWLVLAKGDGSSPSAIEPMGENADLVIVSQSPNGQVAAFSMTGDAAEVGSQRILLIGKNGENLPAITVKGENFLPLWSPDGSRLLYSTASADDDYAPRLYIVNGTGNAPGGDRVTVSLLTTADKCVFHDRRTIYCAVPDTAPEGSGLQPETLAGIPDSIYKIDAASGLVTFIGRPDADMSISRIQASSDGGELFLTDAITGFIKKMLLR